MSFSAKLAAAKAAPRKFKDVEILLDTELSELRDELQSALDDVKRRNAADQRLTSVNNDGESELQEKLDAVIAESQDSVVTIRFFRLPGDAWADIMSRCPARPGAVMDEYYGYNMQTATKLAAPYVDSQGLIYGGRVEGDAVVPLEYAPATDAAPAVNEWADLFRVASGAEQARMESAVWELNISDPDTSLVDLKKKLATLPV